jgi:tRNA (cmo5U34)-methyltransferase
MGFERIFADPNRKDSDFSFNAETAEVFEDMLDRSVPGYREMQRMICELASDFAVDGTNVYGPRLLDGNDDPQPRRDPSAGTARRRGLVAGDARQGKPRLRGFCAAAPYSLVCRNLNEGARVEEASVVVMSLTLQFVRPLYRERLLRDIHRGLHADGCLILVEKVLGEESLLNRLFIQHYHEFKQRNGYSEIEIARKREALENVLMPYRMKENEEVLRQVGPRRGRFLQVVQFCGRPGSQVALESSRAFRVPLRESPPKRRGRGALRSTSDRPRDAA